MDKNKYRFAGYNFDMETMDGTGPSFIVAHPHPYYYNQPAYWQKNSYMDCFQGHLGSGVERKYNSTSKSSHKPLMFRMMSF